MNSRRSFGYYPKSLDSQRTTIKEDIDSIKQIISNLEYSMQEDNNSNATICDTLEIIRHCEMILHKFDENLVKKNISVSKIMYTGRILSNSREMKLENGREEKVQSK